MELLRKRPHTGSNNKNNNYNNKSNKLHIKDRGEQNFFFSFFSHFSLLKLMQSTTFELIKFRLNVRHISVYLFIFCLFISFQINAVECACEFKGKLYKVSSLIHSFLFFFVH